MSAFKQLQRGGRASPRTWLVILLLGVASLSAALNVYLFKHQQLVVVFKQPEQGAPAIALDRVADQAMDPGAAGALNDYSSCDLSWAGCWERT